MKRLLGALCLCALIIFIIFLWRQYLGQPKEYAASVYPDDHNIRCVVFEAGPVFPMQSPHHYQISIQDEKFDDSLEGNEYVFGTDSGEIGKVEFGWEHGKVVVSAGGNQYIGFFDLSYRKQNWVKMDDLEKDVFKKAAKPSN